MAKCISLSSFRWHSGSKTALRSVFSLLTRLFPMLFNFFFNLGSKNVSIFFSTRKKDTLPERGWPLSHVRAGVQRCQGFSPVAGRCRAGWEMPLRAATSESRGEAPRCGGDRGESPFPDGGSSGFITDEKQNVYVIFMWERIRDTFYLRKAQR